MTNNKTSLTFSSQKLRMYFTITIRIAEPGNMRFGPGLLPLNINGNDIYIYTLYFS